MHKVRHSYLVALLFVQGLLRDVRLISLSDRVGEHASRVLDRQMEQREAAGIKELPASFVIWDRYD